MTLLPGYPILYGVFFITLGIYQSFQNARESNDIVFSALLPIAKRDVVKAKYQFSVLIELCGFFMMAILTIVRMTILSGSAVYHRNALMNRQHIGLRLRHLLRDLREQSRLIIHLHHEVDGLSADVLLKREDIIRHIAEASGADPIVSTTGKASRELFEIRTAKGQSHQTDFLTVGSMGHSSSIALGIAVQKPEQRIWCIDGDGAALMHMGAMAVIGANRPKNLIHIVINNGAHETVGGMPTVAGAIDLVGIAKACGYPYAASVDSFDALDAELAAAKERGELSLIEVKCAIGAREDLGRPTTTARENKENFMAYLAKL